MIDSSKWKRDRSRLKCIQGKGHRQLDFHEKKRSRVHRTRQVCRATARRRGDGLRRKRQVDTISARSISAPAPTRYSPSSGMRPRTSSSTRTFSRSATASKSTTTTRWTSSRPRAGSRQNLPYAKVSGGVSNVSFSFAATSRCARRSTPPFVSRRQGRHGHGHRQRRPARRCTTEIPAS